MQRNKYFKQSNVSKAHPPEKSMTVTNTKCMHIYRDKNIINTPKRYFRITLTSLFIYMYINIIYVVQLSIDKVK